MFTKYLTLQTYRRSGYANFGDQVYQIYKIAYGYGWSTLLHTRIHEIHIRYYNY